MTMDHTEYVELKNQLQSEFDGRYVLIEDCEKTFKEEYYAMSIVEPIGEDK